VSKVAALVEFATDVALAYQKARTARGHRRVAKADGLMVLAAVMILTAIGFALAGAFAGLLVWGVVPASLLVAVISLVVSLVAWEVSRRLLQFSDQS